MIREVIKVNEIDAIGYGAKELYKITDSEFLAVSTGTGTACIGLINNEFKHLGGISVGGGTLQWLSNLLFNEVDSEIINKLAIEGNRTELDALIGEVVNDIGSLHPDVTASNFAKARISNNFSNEELQNKNLFIEVEKKKYPIEIINKPLKQTNFKNN